MTEILLKRAYDPYEETDGKRILVDRMWPRGVKKEKLHDDLWAKKIAPTSELRKAFNHEADKFPWFKKEYEKELDANPDMPAFVAQVKEWLKDSNVTFVYGAKDREDNQAVVLKEYVESKLMTK